MEFLKKTSEAECCARFDPALWNERSFEWNNKNFIKDCVFTLFHIPINFGGVMKKLDQKIKTAVVNAHIPDALCLSDHTSKWNMDVYLAVDRKIPEAENITLSGKYFSKVYEGPYKNTGQWYEDFSAYAKRKNLNIHKHYMWYTTCPKCAKKYGKNYVVIIGEVG
jgi:effector-binding domain-containing protein